MKGYAVRSFLMGMAVMIALTIAVAVGAHAAQIGVVNFANGATTPTKIPARLITQAQAAAKGHGRVILLRGGASPVGSRSYNFILSGERTAAIRDRLVAAGIPRKKIVSQFVGIVHRGSARADRAVIIDATTRAALGMAVAHMGQSAALRRLEAQVQALEAAAHKVSAVPKTVPVKAKASPFYTGGVWYATRTAQVNGSTQLNDWYKNNGGGLYPSSSFGDNYQSAGYGFSLHTRRPTEFNFWTPYAIPLSFSMAGMSQKWQVANPVLAGTTNWAPFGNGVLIYPINTRDSVSTQFLHASVASPWNLYGLTVTPGVQVGWLGEQSLSGGETTVPMYQGCTPATNNGQPCPTVTTATTTATGGSAISVTPSLAISGQGWQIGYSQSPWGAQGFAAPRVLMGTVHGRGARLMMGAAFPDCGICQGGLRLSMGKIVGLRVRGDGWSGSVVDVMGEKFSAGGQTMPATLAQALAPYNPAHPWNSYNPGLTVSIGKRIGCGLWATAAYSYESEGGGYTPAPGLISSSTTAVIKTTELSLHGRF